MPAESVIRVACACGRTLKAPAAAAGKKARCPACGNTLFLTVRDPAVVAEPPRQAPVPPPLPVEQADSGDQYDLAGHEAAPPPLPVGRACPHCGAAMDDTAVLCTNCGYDTRTGKPLAGASVATLAAPSYRAAGSGTANSQVDLMAPQGSFLAGLAMSAAFALAASTLWYVCVWATGYSLSLIAILIGGAAGAGMKMGQKGFSSTGGWAAAGMTLFAILIAKLAVLQFIVVPIAAHHNPNVSIFKLSTVTLSYYFFRPISLIIMAIGMFTGFRTANGSISG